MKSIDETSASKIQSRKLIRLGCYEGKTSFENVVGGPRSKEKKIFIGFAKRIQTPLYLKTLHRCAGVVHFSRITRITYEFRIFLEPCSFVS